MMARISKSKTGKTNLWWKKKKNHENASCLWEDGAGIGWVGHEGTLWNDGNVPDFGSHLGYRVVSICQNKSKDELMICPWHWICLKNKILSTNIKLYLMICMPTWLVGEGINAYNLFWNVSKINMKTSTGHHDRVEEWTDDKIWDKATRVKYSLWNLDGGCLDVHCFLLSTSLVKTFHSKFYSSRENFHDKILIGGG